MLYVLGEQWLGCPVGHLLELLLSLKPSLPSFPSLKPSTGLRQGACVCTNPREQTLDL